tara:strand:- start:6344 stop:6841 length:498 start_codon:yes stop_codon:yes gene_type:complete
MAGRYFPARGTLHIISGGGGQKYSSPWEGRAGGVDVGMPESDKNWASIITGYTITEKEVTSKMACIDDERVMYSFGKGFGEITIQCEVFLGSPEGNQSIDVIAEIVNVYEQNRLTSGTGRNVQVPMKLSIAGAGTITYYQTGVDVGNFNPELQILQMNIKGVLAE